MVALAELCRGVVVVCIGGLAVVVASNAHSHPGRRFEVGIADGRLVAQGVNTDELLPDGEPALRPYVNVVHDHFTHYVLNGRDVASANQPGFDIPGSLQSLAGHRVAVEIDGVFTLSATAQHTDPPASTWHPLAPPSELTISLGAQIASSTRLPGSLTLSAAVPREGALDVDPHYALNTHLDEGFLIVRMKLTTDARGVEASRPICVVLAPPGHRFHHAAMAIEERLATEGC